MKVVVYSLHTRKAPEAASPIVWPRRADEWDNMAELYKDMDITVVSQPAGRYLTDIVNGQIADEKPEKVDYIVMRSDAGVDEYVSAIEKLKPDCAIAMSFSVTPLDWNPIRDAMVANKLREKGIRTICNSDYVTVAAFDKWRSSVLLRIQGLDVAEHIYIHHDTFHAGDKLKDHVTNPYAEYVLYKAEHLRFPVVIKSTTGAGSFGIKTASDFAAAKEIILKSSSDIIVEEFLQGEQFGTEIHGCDGNYSVLPPFKLSINAEGFTDPLHSVKYGPVTDEKYHIKELQEKLKTFAENLKLEGITEVDLVYTGGKWVIIEINPRWSGMTTMLAASEGRSPFSVYLDQVKGDEKDYSDPDNLTLSCNFKLPEMTKEKLLEVADEPQIKFISQYALDTKSSGRVNYSEVIAAGFDTARQLTDFFRNMQKKYPELFSDDLCKSFEKLVE